jgi:restriction system protein
VAETSRRRAYELVRGVFRILLDQPEGVPAKTVLTRLATLIPPTDFEKSFYPDRPNVRRYEKIVRFGTIQPVMAGCLVTDKGLWSLSPEGRAAYERFPDPEHLAQEAQRLYNQWKSQQPSTAKAEEAASEEAPAVEAAATLEEAVESSWAQIEAHLTNMPPYDFQKLVAGLLQGMGYHVTWVAPPGPDGGVDIIAQSDPLGINGPRIKVQVKRSDRMDVKEMRAFLALVGDGDVGLFVSTGGFRKPAEEFVRNQERRRTMLIDLQRLFDLWVEHYDKIPEEARRLLSLKPVYFLMPLE